MKSLRPLLPTLFLAAAWILPASAEEFHCEVMSVEGQVTAKSDGSESRPLKEGDLLKAGEWVETAAGASADIAYDSEWKNVTRIEENSKIQIRSVFPSEMAMEKGGIYAKLKSLPKESSFQVTTPTAVAVVRGTEFRTVAGESGSEVFNFSDSDVYVYGMDEKGQMSSSHEPLLLANSQKTQVARRGEFGFRPMPLNMADRARGRQIQEHIDHRVREFEGAGRRGRIQDVKRAENFMQEKIGRGEFKRPEERFRGMKPGPGGPPEGKPRMEGRGPDHDGRPNGHPMKGPGPDGQRGGELGQGPQGPMDRKGPDGPKEGKRGPGELGMPPGMPPGERRPGGAPQHPDKPQNQVKQPDGQKNGGNQPRRAAPPPRQRQNP